MAKRVLSRKELEDMKKRQDEEAAAEVSDRRSGSFSWLSLKLCLLFFIEVRIIGTNFLTCIFEWFRFLKNLLPHFKKIQAKWERFGSKLEHMMPDREVS